MLKLTPEQAGNFYDVHRARPFFQELVDFMTSGPILVQVLEGPDAIAKNREVMGATDPAKAAPGTIRAEFGKNISENAVHGSDAPDTARTEIAFSSPPASSARAEPMSDPLTNLLNFDAAGLARYVETLGERPYRATQLIKWVHQQAWWISNRCRI